MACARDACNEEVIESLQLPDDLRNSASMFDDKDFDLITGISSLGVSQCLLCHLNFELPDNSNQLHQHLLLEHNLIIRDSHLICDLKEYIEYWRTRFSQGNFESICANHNEKDGRYSLDPSMTEDKQIREYLQLRRLDAVLKTQQHERDDVSLSRSCLFCRRFFEGNRAALFNHMAFDHNFNVGQPDNIVFANQFLNLLESKLQSLQCLYCEKIFRDKTTLKDHMRKKQHRRLNPNNKSYDKFYVINYLEVGKDWQEVQAERDVIGGTLESENEESWADWNDDFHTSLVCLYCNHSASAVTDILNHMRQKHSFDLSKIRDDLALSFYDQIKLVNFIRRCVHQVTCPYCDEKFEGRESLSEHWRSHDGHMESGLEKSKWNQPQFLFPTYENDALLCSLEDISDEKNDKSAPRRHSTSDVPIHAEDQHISENCIFFKEGDVLQSLVNL